MNLRLKHTFTSQDESVTVKIYFNSDPQEYIVRLYRDGKLDESADYFTTELEDAWYSAQHILVQAASGFRPDKHKLMPPAG